MKKHRFLTGYIKMLLLAGYSLALSNSTVAQNNLVSTYAGTGTAGYLDGDTATCRFKSPFGMCRDASGNLYIADQTNHCIRKITPDGIVTTHAETGTAGYGDGPASAAQFNQPADLCADAAGNIYVTDFANQYIRKISTGGQVTTVAGNGTEGYTDGPAASAQFNYPRGIAIDQSGNLYIGDSWNHRIRKVDKDGIVSTYAGGGNSFGVQSINSYLDGTDTAARFCTPCGLAIDAAGNIYVADAYNHCIRKIDTARLVTTLAGMGATGAANGDFADGAAATSRFNTPTEVFATYAGEVYVGDTYNHRIRRVSAGAVTTIAGRGEPGLVNGFDTLAEFNNPRGLVLDVSGNRLYVCDQLNRVIRKIVLGGIVSVNAVAENDDWLIFPNPSHGSLFVKGNSTIDAITLHDISGSILFTRTFTGEIHEINLVDRRAGVYFLTLKNQGSAVKSFRVVLQD